jgi:hypothetical protein
MRELVKIIGVLDWQVGKEAFDKLVHILPAGLEHGFFSCELPLGDQRIDEVVAVLASAGWHPRTEFFLPAGPNEYHMDIRRQYVTEDLKDAALLQPIPQIVLERSRSEFRTQRTVVPRCQLPKMADHSIVGPDGWHFMVTGELRARMETQGFERLHFRDCVLYDDESDREVPWESEKKRLWELVGDTILPPVHASMTLLDKTGRPCNGDDSNGCYTIERGAYGAKIYPVPFVFPERGIKALPRFDYALTHERFGNRPLEDGRLPFVSKRFYEFCTLLNLPLDWAPARVTLD